METESQNRVSPKRSLQHGGDGKQRVCLRHRAHSERGRDSRFEPDSARKYQGLQRENNRHVLSTEVADADTYHTLQVRDGWILVDSGIVNAPLRNARGDIRPSHGRKSGKGALLKYIIMWALCIILVLALAYEFTRALDETIEQRLRILDDTSHAQRVAIIDRLKGEKND